MDRLTRKELKSDRFALEVQHGVEYMTDHRQSVMRYALIGVAVIVVIVGVYLYMRYESGIRLEAFQAAQRVENGQVGPAQNEYAIAFPTQADKDKAADKAWTELAAKYGTSDEGVVAHFYLGGRAADRGDLSEASRHFQVVIDHGSKDYAALAKLAEAQVLASQGKLSDGRNMLQSVIDHPTATVSKEEAIIALAHLLAPTDPGAARKLLEPLRTNERAAVSRAALSALSELPK